MGLSDYATALEMREIIKRLVAEELDAQRPRHRMATVVSIDRVLRKSVVTFTGDTTNATVSMGSIQPSAVGQVVRVEGLAGDRYIADVLGAPYEPLETRVSNIEAAPGETSNFVYNSGFENGMDNWSFFWSNAITGSVQYSSANAYSGANCFGGLFDAVTDTLVLNNSVYPVEPGQVISLSYVAKIVGTATIVSRLDVLTAPTEAGCDYFGTGVIATTVIPNATATTSHVVRRGLFTVPAGHYFIRPVVRADCTAYTSATTIYVDEVTARRVLVQPPGSDPITYGGTATFNGVANVNNTLSVNNAFDTDGFTGNGWYQYEIARRAQSRMLGGGVRAVTSTGVSWDSRFIAISLGKSAALHSAGYFQMDMPADGVVITGVAGASSATVASGLIPLASWIALYYIPPFGTTGTSVTANYRLVYYNTDYIVPSTWVLLCHRNGDTGAVTWGDGREQDYWRGVTYTNSWVSYGAPYVGAQYKKENGYVHIRGLVTDGTISSSSTGTIFTLPVGFRPGYQLLHMSISNQLIGRVDVNTDGSVKASLGSAGSWISLYNIRFQAEA